MLTKNERRGRTEIAPALESEDGSHETASGPRCSELGRDDSTQRVIATDTNAHKKPPYDEGANDTDGGTATADCLAEGANNNDHKLDAI